MPETSEITSEQHEVREEMILLEGDEEMLLDHNYDGIQEFDNPTPAWWHIIFWLSIVFSAFYVGWFHWGLGDSVIEQYDDEVTAYYETLFAAVGDLEPDEPTILRVMHDPEMANFLPVAESVFIAKCAACHGSLGQGGTGPNMTDDRFLNVKELTDIADVIRNGARNGAMPAWEGRLHPNQITLLSGYVAKLRGTNIPGKAGEGDVLPPWPEYAPE